MGSLTASPQLLVVNFNNEELRPGTATWESTCKEIRFAFENHGSFIALYDKISPQLQKSIFQASQQLFELPLEKKVLNTNEKPYHGYVGQIPFLPHHEAFGIDYATTSQGIQSFSNLMWPQGNDFFGENSLMFSKIVAELDQKVVRMLFESYGIGKNCESYLESTTYLLRYLKYDAPNTKENSMVFPPHTDKTFTTILYQNRISGLEVQTRDGQWINMEFPPSSFVVMAGEACRGWSNDRVLTPVHKVIMDISGNETRYTVGIFTFLKDDKMIEVAEELVDEEHPLQFKPFVHIDLIKFFDTERGRRSQDLLKDFCGV
ncbi:putative 2-oxoglutarate-dependent dioxygenase AOP1 [Nicotiana tabacum]|uniref:2-oxoglutarate-dependent dioxygenase AOP1 n=1 Tax=Nicotiana tabacum TaxID=4097 RepID=A0A1S3ZFF5_TOBAC|nr:probable 2-oxoglutarate-dependent dioxygenase AOP1 [Nicotiana tomentosiformis]XP_016463016.1 PREDICTED: probable 2-oxoglutarate-dependent dioxygenase AOP1 [Nicotiana tabacum]